MPARFDGCPVDVALIVGNVDAEARVRVVIRHKAVVIFKLRLVVCIERHIKLRNGDLTLVKILNDKLAVLRHRGRRAVAGALPVGFPAERG